MRTPDHFYRDKIAIYPNPTLDKFGKKTDNEPRIYMARFVERNFVIKDSKGKEVNCDGLVHVNSALDISIDDTLEYNDQTYDVVGNKKAKHGSGVVVFQKLSVKLRK
jgi:hypothetical protein